MRISGVLLTLILLAPACARRSEAPGTAPAAGVASSWPFTGKARVVEAPKAMVVAGSPIASDVGRDILRQGG
ncbi:MAG: hypothetical protein QOH59_1373, partial [Gemmatimonadales bacterium]|nr:hypothetical protein [Gemmatimonadales bacterium]